MTAQIVGQQPRLAQLGAAQLRGQLAERPRLAAVPAEAP